MWARARRSRTRIDSRPEIDQRHVVSLGSPPTCFPLLVYGPESPPETAEGLGGPGLLVKSKIPSRPAPSRRALADDGDSAVSVDRVTVRRGEQRLRHRLLRARGGIENDQAVT